MDSNKSKRVVVYCRVGYYYYEGEKISYNENFNPFEPTDEAERLGYEIVGEVSECEKGTTLDRDGWKKGLSGGVGAKGGHSPCCRAYTDSARPNPLDAGFARVERQGRLDLVRC